MGLSILFGTLTNPEPLKKPRDVTRFANDPVWRQIRRQLGVYIITQNDCLVTR